MRPRFSLFDRWCALVLWLFAVAEALIVWFSSPPASYLYLQTLGPATVAIAPLCVVLAYLVAMSLRYRVTASGFFCCLGLALLAIASNICCLLMLGTDV